MNDSSTPVLVSWLADARRDLPLELKDQISDELLVAFANSSNNATRSESQSSLDEVELRTIIVSNGCRGLRITHKKS